MIRRPNILFLMSDEHRADVTGYEGNSIIRTPVLDELAQTGVVFRNAYTASPICIPGRQCMMTGQLPRTCRCFRYGQDLPPFSMTFAKRLSQYGYKTVAAGKLHHMGADQMQGWTQRIGSDMSVSSWYVDGLHKEFTPPRAEHGKWSDAKEIQRAGVGHGPSTQDADQYSLEGALRVIANHFTMPFYDRATPDHPILLKVSFNRPHYPYFTTEEKFTNYLNRVEPYLETETFNHPFLSQRQVKPGVDVTERDLRRATAAYYGMIDEIDEDYGRVLDALRHVGQDLNDWIIIYTTDHGEMLGQHGIWEKQKFFEASVRVPLIIRWPKEFQGGRIVEENVNLCDLFATLCDLTGIPASEDLDSRSLVRFLTGASNPEWSNETISHFGITNLMIKQDHLKYQYYGEDMPEVLFDLQRDPDERQNYLDDPAYTDAVGAFRKRRAELGYGPNADPNYVNAGYSM